MSEFKDKYYKIFTGTYAVMQKYYMSRPEDYQTTLDSLKKQFADPFHISLLNISFKEIKRFCDNKDSSQTFKEKYFDIFGDIYKYMEKHFGAKKFEEWLAACKEAGDISDKYNDDKIVVDLLVAVLLEIERIYNDGRKEAY